MIALDRLIRTRRRRLALALAAGALALAVVTAHGAMSGMDHVGTEVAMCMAVVETAVMLAGAWLALGATSARLPLPTLPLAPGPQWRAAPPTPRARAGPPFLQVFRE